LQRLAIESFNSKPLLNHSIDGKNNVLADSAAADGISQVARYWLAGLVKQARGLTALCCPTVNCYRRLHGPSAPCRSSVSRDDNDQTSSLSLKSTGMADTVVINRLPGGSANPYNVMAATVAAGLAGIQNKYPPQERDVEVLLSKSLSEALDALEKDEVLVKALGVEFIQRFYLREASV